jgi:transposase
MRRVGIDLALRADFRAVVCEEGQQLGRSFPVPRTKAGLDKLVAQATDGLAEPCEFVMEPTGLAWLPVAVELCRRGHRTYLPKPQKTHALRSFYSSFAKSDGLDARALALIRHVDPDGVYELRVPSAERTSLRMFVKQRARLVGEAANNKTRIHSWLVAANPHLSVALAPDAFSGVGTAFLRRFLDPFEVRRRGEAHLRRFWARHSRGAVNEAQFQAVWVACQTTCDLYGAMHASGALPFRYEDLQWLVNQELDRVEFLHRQVLELDQAIRRLYRQLDPDRILEREIPGVGEKIAAALEAFVGDVERFPNIKSFSGYFGLVPRTNQTAGVDRQRQRLTQAGPRVLKQYLFLAAETARRCDRELAATYARCIARGKHHFSAVVIVAHKLVRRVYALLKLRAATARSKSVLEGHAAVVKYELRRPDNGALLTRAQARAYIQEQYPAKAARGAKETAAPAEATQSPGSHTGATTAAAGTPPLAAIPYGQDCGNPVPQPVDDAGEPQGPLPLEGS